MPRKVKSSGVATGGRKTSLARAMGARTGPQRRAGSVPDGGKWAGSGRKAVEHSEGPEVARQAQTGRGAKTRTALRQTKANHPSHG